VTGYHLTLDGLRIRRQRGDIETFLHRAVEITGLTAISKPFISLGERLGAGHDIPQIGFVVIAESHVSVHIQADRAFADVFSCRQFPAEAIHALCRKLWKGKWSSRMMERTG
jgi:S-adenosylmethionine/arginine decarboxylase-like enzyme